MKNWKW